jgi:hypothetical protein
MNGGRGMCVGYWLKEGKIPLGRPTCRWVDNIKIGWDGVDEIDLA